MNLAVWPFGQFFTFAVLFANKTSAAEYVALNPKTGKRFEWNRRQAKVASEKFRTKKGDNWEHGDLNYTMRTKDGEVIKLFQRVAMEE
jgi:hypothetical protein